MHTRHDHDAPKAKPMLPVKIAGIGFYLPRMRVTSAELEQRLELPPGWIERVTGVRERRYGGEETAANMAAAAARMALDQAALGVEDLDAIIGASAAPQQTIPCTAVFVQRALGAPEGMSACFDINATCMSFLFALQSAAQLVAAGVYRTILICSSEIPDRSLNPHEHESAVLFGAAAAAAVLTSSAAGDNSTIATTLFATYSTLAELSEVPGGGTLHHPNDPATTPELNMFHMDGIQAFKKVVRLMDPFLERFFTVCPWQREEFAAVVPHQGSRHVIEQLSSRFGFRPDQVVSNLALRGNCIGASIPLALAEAIHSERIRRDDKILLIGAGAGFTLAATALIL